MTTETTIYLTPSSFSEKEKLLVKSGGLSASGFIFDRGVCAVRLKNETSDLVLLPFQGQQIWSARFRGRDVTMHSMFTQPNPTRTYLETYGGFLIHCGATAMGVPTHEDTHPLHGELPNAPYQAAYIVTGSDAEGDYIGLGGAYQHTVAFSTNYLAEPLVKLYAGKTSASLSMDITNLKKTEMELMYLAHINFKPVNGSRLVYSAQTTPDHVRVRTSIPSHIHPKPGYVEFIEALKEHPEKHHHLVPGLAFDPEIVFFIDYLADTQGWAYSMQVLPDGNADFVRHRPAQLDKGVRWICRTPDQDALGLILPGTAEPEGYTAEKAKGNLKILPGGAVFHFDVEFGALTPSEASELEARIKAITRE